MAVNSATIATALGQAAPQPNSVTDKQWLMWIADAQMLIADRKAKLNIETDIDEAKLDYVVREAVVAHVKKPDDATQVTIAVDDGQTSKTYKSAKGRVQILDEWWLLLGLTDPEGAFVIDMLGASTMHLPWCAFSLGANYCSCGVDIAGVPIFELGDAE